MKRTSAITQLLTVLLLAGCSQNEVTDVNPDSHPAVGFGVYTGLATRGVDMTTETYERLSLGCREIRWLRHYGIFYGNRRRSRM